jgi:hypothetical protein
MKRDHLVKEGQQRQAELLQEKNLLQVSAGG